MVGPGHVSRSAPESGISNFKLSCKTINQYISNPKKLRIIPSVVLVSEKYSGQNFGDFGHARRPALESDILNFEIVAKLHILI